MKLLVPSQSERARPVCICYNELCELQFSYSVKDNSNENINK
jgi:hypothetical protein